MKFRCYFHWLNRNSATTKDCKTVEDCYKIMNEKAKNNNLTFVEIESIEDYSFREVFVAMMDGTGTLRKEY